MMCRYEKSFLFRRVLSPSFTKCHDRKNEGEEDVMYSRVKRKSGSFQHQDGLCYSFLRQIIIGRWGIFLRLFAWFGRWFRIVQDYDIWTIRIHCHAIVWIRSKASTHWVHHRVHHLSISSHSVTHSGGLESTVRFLYRIRVEADGPVRLCATQNQRAR